MKRSYRGSKTTKNGTDHPRTIVAKFANCKTKEIVLKKARLILPPGIKFVPDLSPKTLAKRDAQVGNLLEARRNGKHAFFVLDKLIIKDKPGHVNDKNTHPSANSDYKVSFNTA